MALCNMSILKIDQVTVANLRVKSLKVENISFGNRMHATSVLCFVFVLS